MRKDYFVSIAFVVTDLFRFFSSVLEGSVIHLLLLEGMFYI